MLSKSDISTDSVARSRAVPIGTDASVLQNPSAISIQLHAQYFEPDGNPESARCNFATTAKYTRRN